MVFIGLISLTDSDQKDSESTFFPWMTIVANAFIYIASGIYVSSAIGSVANMPEKYINALILGLGLGSVIYALSEIIGTYLGRDSKPMAMIFFTTLVVIHIFCIFLAITLESNVMYFLLIQIVSKNVLQFSLWFYQKFRLYYQNLTENEWKSDDNRNNGNRYLYVFAQIFPQLFDLFLTSFVTFSLSPFVISNIKSSDHWISDDNDDQYFSVIFGTLVVQSFTFIGMISANYIRYPTPDSMIAFTSARLFLIPISLFFDYEPPVIGRSKELPVLFKSDAIYVAFNAILGITSGHFWALSLMCAPKKVGPQYSRIAGMMSQLFVLYGNLFGYHFSSVLKNIV